MTETVTPIKAGQGAEKAFTFTINAGEESAQELFHITYDGEFVFSDGVEIEEAARVFAKFFNEEMTPFTAVRSAAKAIAHSSLRRPGEDYVLLPIELLDDLRDAVRVLVDGG